MPFPDHPPMGGFRGGTLYPHPMWGAVAAGAVALQEAQATSNAIAFQQAQANANAAIIAANQTAMATNQLKPAINAHLTTASQILQDPAPSPATTATANLHVTAAQTLLAQT